MRPSFLTLPLALIILCCGEATSGETEMLVYALNRPAVGVDDACVDSSTRVFPQQRYWATVLWIEGRSGAFDAGDVEFQSIGRRFHRATALPVTVLPRPQARSETRIRFHPSWWNWLFCDHRIVFYTPLVDGNMAFVVADEPFLMSYWVFVQRDGHWQYLAYGHASDQGIVE